MPHLFKFCVLSLGLLLVFPPLAEAQVSSPGWRKGGCTKKGCNYFKVINRDYPFVIAKMKDTINEFTCDEYYCIKELKKEFNCETGKSRFRKYRSHNRGPYEWSKWSEWDGIYPGTVGEFDLRAACRP